MTKDVKYLSLTEAAKYMGAIHPVHLRKLAQTGQIPAVKFSDSPKAQWFFEKKVIDKEVKRKGQNATIKI